MASRTKLIIFSLRPATAVLLLLVAAEIGLRLFNRSLDMPFVTVQQYAGQDWYQITRGYLEKYFPADNVLIPDVKPSILRVRRVPGSIRIICLGESTMFGVPYQMNATIPGILRKQLRHRYPDRDVEVINLAASAINSNVILDLAPQVAALQPDAVLLYVGHNEFYGPDGAGASFLEKTFPFLTPWKYRLRDLRLVRLFQRTLHRSVAARETEPNLMREVSRGARIPSGSSDAERVYWMFERNLEGIIREFQANGIPVVVSDVTGNPLFPPFDYDPREGFDKAEQDFSSGRYRDVVQELAGVLSADPTNAFAEYWSGRSYLALGETDSAREFLWRAMDDDLLKFRAPSRTNRIIHDVCSRLGTTCVSSDTLFRSLSPDGIPGSNLFWEHLHPTPQGYYDIAGLYLQAMEARHLVPDTAARVPPLLPFQRDSLSICWMELGFGDISMRALTSRWPFNRYPVTPLVIAGADMDLVQIVSDVYGRKIGWDDGCLRTASAFRRKQDFRDALTTYQAMIEDFPYNYYVHYLAGNLLKDMGDLSAADHELAESMHLNPHYAFTFMDRGLLEVNRGAFDSAIVHLNRALTLLPSLPETAPARATVYYGLGGAYANKSDYQSALKYLDQSIALVPSYEAAVSLHNQIRRR